MVFQTPTTLQLQTPCVGIWGTERGQGCCLCFGFRGFGRWANPARPYAHEPINTKLGSPIHLAYAGLLRPLYKFHDVVCVSEECKPPSTVDGGNLASP